MRIPENAISTKHKKRRKNPLHSIPGGFYVALLLVLIWGGGALLGVWIQGAYPSNEASASIKTAEGATQTLSQSGELSLNLPISIEGLFDFNQDEASPVFQADELEAFASKLDLNRTYQISSCYPYAADYDDGGVFLSLAFARGAQVATAIKAIQPHLNLQVQSLTNCQLAYLEIDEVTPQSSYKLPFTRISLALESLSQDERLFFEQAYNQLLLYGHQLLLIKQGEGDQADKLVRRLVNQGFASEKVWLHEATSFDSKTAAFSDYLMAYVVPETPKS